MPDSKISNLPLATEVNGRDILLVIKRSGNTTFTDKKIEGDSFFGNISSNTHLVNGASLRVSGNTALGDLYANTIYLNGIDIVTMINNANNGGGGGNSNTPITKEDIGLGNVDNTSDANKPVSTPQTNALALKLNISAKANTATALAGVNDSVYMTPLKTSTVVSQALSSVEAEFDVIDTQIASLTTTQGNQGTAITQKLDISAKANTATAVGGTDDISYMTSLKTANLIDVKQRYAESSYTANFNVATSDVNKIIVVNSASGVTATLQADTFSVGTILTFMQAGAGVITLSAGAGVTLNPATVSRAQYAFFQVWQRSANVWVSFGSIQ